MNASFSRAEYRAEYRSIEVLVDINIGDDIHKIKYSSSEDNEYDDEDIQKSLLNKIPYGLFINASEDGNEYFQLSITNNIIIKTSNNETVLEIPKNESECIELAKQLDKIIKVLIDAQWEWSEYMFESQLDWEPEDNIEMYNKYVRRD